MTFQELMNCYALSSNENNRITYNELLSQFRGQNVTPVIGAGLSTWAYPRWNELLKEQASTIGLQSEIETMLNNNQYEEAASLLEKELTYYGFLRVLQNVFDPSLTEEKADQCPEYSKLLPHIFRGPVVTTNFDRVIEYLFRVENVGHPDTVTPQDVFQGQQMDHAIHENSSILVKMHGDIQAPEHMVLTKQSYDETYGSDALNPDLTKPMPAFLAKILERNPILFLGCSLNADRTCRVIESCAPNHPQFALLPLPKETKNKHDPVQPVLRDSDGRPIKEFWDRRRQIVGEFNIRPIWYPFGMHDVALNAFFSQLAADLNITPPPNVPVNDADYTPLHTLLGRDDLVKNIADVLDGQEPLCVWVDGPAGVGKTEVCKRVYAILKSRHSNFAMPYIDITGVSSLPAFFNAVAEGIKKPIPNHIGIDAAPNQLIEILKERRPTDTAFRTLYFDNWEDIWYGLSKQEEKDLLVNWMRTLLTNGFKLLVSSREVAPAVLSSHIFHVFPLDNAVTWTSALPKEKLNSLDSVKLFRSILVRDIIDTEWDSFVSLICQLEGHPLAIVLTATQAQCEISLNNLLHRWDKAKQDTVGIHKEHKNLEIALQVSWNAICSNQEAVMQWGLHYYSLKPIPEDVFLKLRGDCSEEAWQEGSRILMGANLTYATQNREAISMLLPLKKQFNRLSAADKEVREACLIRWAEYIKNLLLFANQRLSADRQIWHHKTIEFLPQIFCVIEQLMVCRTGLTNRYLDLISMKIRNYFQFSIQSLSLLKKLVDYYAKLNHPFLPYFLIDRGDLLSMLGDPDGAIAAYDSAEPLFRQERNNLGLANLLRSRGDLLSMLGHPNRAMAAYDEAESLFHQERDNLGLANLLRSRGDLLSMLGDSDGAMAAYDSAEPLFRQERDNLGLANLLISRGDLLSTLGDPNRAMVAYDNAEPLFRQERDNLGLANLLISRGDLLSTLGDPNRAMAAYDSAEPLFRQERDNLGLANLLISRGNLLSMLGDLDGAMAAYDSAEPLFRHERDNLGLANLLRSRGDLLSMLGDSDGAMAAYDSAEPLFRQECNNWGMANLLKSRGDLLSKLDDLDGAMAAYDSAEPLFRHERNNLGLANLLKLRGDLLKLKKEFTQAYLIYKEAEKLYVQVQSLVGRAYTLAELYECCTQLNYFSEAKEIKAQAKALLKNIPYKDVNKYVTKKLHLRQYCANPKNKKCNTVY